MPSSWSTLKIELIADGEQTGTWGQTTNNNLGGVTTGSRGLEQAIVGMATLVTGDFTANSYTLSYNDTNDTQDFRALVLNITATLSAAGQVIVPSIEKPYIVMNNSVGGHAVTVKTSLGTGISVPSGKTMWVYNNGTNVVDAVTHLSSLTLGTALPITSGGTGSTSTQFVNLATNVTGDLPFANLAQGSALSVLGVTGNATADVASIAAATDNQVLRRSGTSVAFGAVNLASTDAVTGDLPFTNIAQIAGLSVAGRSTNTTGDLAAITAAADHNVLRRSGTTIGFGAINIAQAGAVTGTLAVGNGGTGGTTFTANNVLLGNGTSAFQVVAPGTSGNVLTSDGTTWTSAAPSITTGKAIAMAIVFG